MGLFTSRSGKTDINQAIANREPDSIVIDVREPKEYAAGHIPGSINIPGARINTVDEVIPEMDTPLYIYCLSGARSSRAVASLQGMGYSNVKNIGGINQYKGQLEK